MDNEIWKDIEGYEGLYQVSNLGNVRSMDRTIMRQLRGKTHTRRLNGRMLKQWNGADYLHVTLSKNGAIFAPFVHKLVASAFVENPDGYKQVNHKDENKWNNNADNLEWCDQKYNRNYGTGEQRRVIAYMESAESHNRKRTPVIRMDKSGNVEKRYFAMNQVSKDGFNVSNVCLCCEGRRKTHGGYLWAYA